MIAMSYCWSFRSLENKTFALYLNFKRCHVHVPSLPMRLCMGQMMKGKLVRRVNMKTLQAVKRDLLHKGKYTITNRSIDITTSSQPVKMTQAWMIYSQIFPFAQNLILLIVSPPVVDKIQLLLKTIHLKILKVLEGDHSGSNFGSHQITSLNGQQVCGRQILKFQNK